MLFLGSGLGSVLGTGLKLGTWRMVKIDRGAIVAGVYFVEPRLTHQKITMSADRVFRSCHVCLNPLPISFHVTRSLKLSGVN